MYSIIWLSTTDHSFFHYIFQVTNNYITEPLNFLSISYFREYFKQFSSYSNSFFQSLNHFSSFFDTWFFKCQLQNLVSNSLKRFLETIYILFMTLINFSIWMFDVQNNVLVIILKKLCSRCKPQFLAENQRKSDVLNVSYLPALKLIK